MIEFPNKENQFHRDHVALLLSSYRRWIGRTLFNEGANEADTAKLLFESPIVVVSHGVSEDPIFNYGNQTALNLFAMTWQEFTKLPSRKSVEPLNREERARLLATVTEQNYIDDYSGVRISSQGKRFHIPRATVWNVVDDAGVYRGQAATFSAWTFLEE